MNNNEAQPGPWKALPPRPERILQFGTGILLRGLPDYFVHLANEQGLFDGSIVVVKSTPGSTDDFAQQHNQYTTVVRGIAYGKPVADTFVNAAISRVVAAPDAWPDIMALANAPQLQVIISNTTEVGIQYVDEDIHQSPPESFPAKLTAFLYARYQQAPQIPTVVVPTELVSDNGTRLKEIVSQHAAAHRLGEGFGQWLDGVPFCNSLVDRIVTPLSQAEQAQLSYEDPLAIQTEPYCLWAIEGDAAVGQLLSFAAADPGVVVTPDITYYRERKLRLLNGTHTISVPLAFLSGLDTVKEMMADDDCGAFVVDVAHQEIRPTVPTPDPQDLATFAEAVLDRFRNPATEHRLLNITLQQTAKMKMRNVATLQRYYDTFGQVPPLLARGFAAYLLFMKCTARAGSYYGTRQGVPYEIRDDQAALFAELWQQHQGDDLVGAVLRRTDLWEADLTQLPGFADAVGVALGQLEAKTLA